VTYVTVRACVPELPKLWESPPYVASTVTLPAAAPLTVTEHAPEDRVQAATENVTFPVPETVVHVTVPVWGE